MKHTWLTYLLIVFCIVGYGQRNVTSILRIIQNDNVPLIFNGVNDFQNGVTLEDWTKFEIYFNDTTTGGIAYPSGNGWELYVKSEDIEIYSLSNSTSLPLSTIEMRVFYGGDDHGPYVLSNDYQLIAKGDNQVNVTEDIFISYDCGTNPANRVENFTERDFIINLNFKLQPNPLP